MIRPHDWPERLDAFIESRRHAPFSWESNNCGLFAADWINCLFGIDLAEVWRGRSVLVNMRQVKAAGGVDELFDITARHNCWPCVHPALAQRGDVISYLTPRGPALGVCLGEDSAFMQKTGVGFVPTSKCQRAWRI